MLPARVAITAAELLREASAAADRAGTLELSEAELAATGSFGRSVNRKVADVPRAMPAPPPASPWVSNRTRSAAGKALELARHWRYGLETGGWPAPPTTCSGPLPAVCPDEDRVRRLRGLRDALKSPRLTMARWLRAETPRASREARNIFEIREASP